MRGVDKADLFCVVHGLNRNSKKWWHRIFFGIIDRTLVNAYIAYCKLEGGKVTTLDFRRHVTKTQITLSQSPKVGRPSLSVTPRNVAAGVKELRVAISLPPGSRHCLVIKCM